MLLRKLVIAAAVAAASLGAAAPPSSAETFLAVGEGLTSCRFEVNQMNYFPLSPWWRYEGITDCSRPVEQTGQAWAPYERFELCSGYREHCYSGYPPEHEEGYYEGPGPGGALEYHVTLRAPLGQGWVGAPTNCTGVGTDNLKCVFKDNTTSYLH